MTEKISQPFGNTQNDETLLAWSDVQGSILTGGGELAKRTTVGVDFEESELPHYLLAHRKTWKQFAKWLEENRRSFEIVGAWSRPIFAGGWNESSSYDTEAFNLQTPSIFIDMRIPVHRPTSLFQRRGALSHCSNHELRLLARQHCFAGYSLPVYDNGNAPTSFVRHHIIDWNYHPSFPRNRPNRWWVTTDISVQRKKIGNDAFPSSFKEFSFARDQNGVPVYFERWSRRPTDSGGEKYLAMRRKAGCPILAAKMGTTTKRDAVLVVVGNHFTLCVDRPQPQPILVGAPGPAGPAFVDYALAIGDRAAAMDFLELEGSYGHIYSENVVQSGVLKPNWKIIRSTHPWREGRELFTSRDTLALEWKETPPSLWGPSIASHKHLSGITWGDDEWEVLECSFSEAELNAIFPTKCFPSLTSKL
jgi:hypothetical protein